MLKEIEIPPILDTSSHDLVNDFFTPLLSASVRYDRGVGYFSSGWLRMAAQGLAAFAAKGGHARWITSPMLARADWKAMQDGDAARQNTVLQDALKKTITDLAETLEKDTLSALAWMIADDILDFKLALPHGELSGEFHDKFGIFTDEHGDRVSFNGSYNDSLQGFRNYESIKVFCSWKPALAALVESDAARFERLWRNEDPNVSVFDLPAAARAHLVRHRSHPRPYRLPARKEVHDHPASYDKRSRPSPGLPASIQLRAYQQDAIQAWFDNGCRGLLEMATGTGKTITALAALSQLLRRDTRLLVVVACPYGHLATQWAEEVEIFGFQHILAFGSAGPWEDILANQLLGLAANYTDHLVVLTTYDTFSDERFMALLREHPSPMLLIADEVHDAGAPKRRRGLLDAYTYRLGLSATPQRWLDEEGTTFLIDYFDRSVFAFPLSKAIPEFLTPYEYHPYFVDLEDEELAQYQEMTRTIARRRYAGHDAEEDEILSLFLIRRQQIIVNAASKYRCLERILDRLPRRSHTLVYCSPEQIDRTQAILNLRGIVQSRFTGQESLAERKQLLHSFAEEHHEMLVAMKCLDQGVDVPATHTAILMASSGNPKEFIQRRGRVLRKAPGKEKAVIHDIIVVPTLNGQLDDETLQLERRILRRELRRYHEFAKLSLNRVDAISKIGPVKRKYLIA